MMRIVSLWAAVFATLAVMLSGVALAEPAKPAWPHMSSDLPADPAITFGVLPNGMRYAIQPNRTPPGQVSLFLIIQAGSMHEAKDQEGLAHFLEHLAFQGSKTVPAGEVVHKLERMGLRPGADVNAGTGPQSTVYFFNLARNDKASVETGLGLLREIASELTLDPQRIEAERNVLLAEERLRAGPQQTLQTGLMAAQVGEHPYGRPTIGRREVIEAAPPARIRAFYDAYYRPERAVLLVVGEVTPSEIEAHIKGLFSDWRGRGPAGGDPEPLYAPSASPPIQIVTAAGVSQNGLALNWRRPYASPPLDRAEAIRRERESIAAFAFNQRLIVMANDAGKPFSPSGLGRNDIEGVARGATIQAGMVSDPRRTLEILLRARSQLLAFGLTQAEIDRVISLRRLGLQRGIESAATRSNMELVAGLQGYAASGYATLSPTERLALFEAAARDFTAEQASQSLRERFGGAPSVLYFGAEPPQGGEAMLASVLSAKDAPQTAYVAPTVKPWSHTDFGRPGRVAERREIKDLGVHFVRFANGVRLTVKPTDFAKGQVEVNVRFGHGQLDLPRDRLTAADWATAMLSSGGLKDMNREEMLRSNQGKGVIALVFQNEDTFAIVNGPSGTPIGTPASALDLQLQVMAAMVSRPGWRHDSWASLIASSARGEASASASPGAVFSSEGRALLHSNDMRWVRSTYAMHATWKPEDAVAFMKPILATAPLEVIIVGDVTVDRAIDETAKTFGALPARAERPEPAGLRDVKFPAPTLTPVVLRHKGRADQAMAHISWPTTDLFTDTRGYQAANVLAGVMASRATERLRNTSGKAYAPGARADFSWNLPGYGRIGASVDVAPGDVGAAYATLDAIAAELAATELSADELARVLSPRVEAAKRELKANGAWAGGLAGAQADPRRLDFLRNRVAELEGLTPADIQAAARKWLVKEKSWRLTILPEPDAATTAETKTPAPASAEAGV